LNPKVIYMLFWRIKGMMNKKGDQNTILYSIIAGLLLLLAGYVILGPGKAALLRLFTRIQSILRLG